MNAQLHSRQRVMTDDEECKSLGEIVFCASMKAVEEVDDVEEHGGGVVEEEVSVSACET